MLSWKPLLAALVCYFATIGGAWAADAQNSPALSSNLRAIAEITLNFRHFATDQDKMKLQTIASDNAAPANVRALASALLAVNHTPTAADKEKLTRIANDNKASTQERDLARIIAALNHRPSDADSAAIKAMLR